MKLNSKWIHRIGSALILFTGVGHSIGVLTSEPGAEELAVQKTMAQVYPMAMAPDKSLLDFHMANDWLIGLMYFSFGLSLLLVEPNRKLLALSTGVCAISAGVAFKMFPLPPAIFLTTAALFHLVATVAGTSKKSGSKR